MAGKEDPMKNFGAGGRGRAPAEKAEVVEEEEFKVGYGAQFIPQPLRPIPGREMPEMMEAGWEGRPAKVDRWVSPFLLGRRSGRRGSPGEEGKEADFAFGGLMPCTGTSTLSERTDEGTLAGAKRKSEEAGDEEVDACTEGGKAAVAAGTGDVEAPAPTIKFVKMPEDMLFWILSQEKESGPLAFDPTGSTFLSPEEIERDLELVRLANASLKRYNDGQFFRFQAWVRDKYEKNGRVMVPEDFLFQSTP